MDQKTDLSWFLIILLLILPIQIFGQLSWERIPNISEDINFSSVIYGKNQFIAICDDGQIFSSWKGTAWKNAGSIPYASKIAFCSQMYLLLRGNMLILMSSDGSNWSEMDMPGIVVRPYFQSITYGNRQFLATDGSFTITSSDGLKWTRKYIDSITIYSVTFAHNLFIGVGWMSSKKGGPTGTIVTSADGSNWKPKLSGKINILNCIAYGNNIFVAVGDSGSIFTSNEGNSWKRQSSGVITELKSVTYGKHQFVAVGANVSGNMYTGGTIISSTNGSDWTFQTKIPNVLNSVAYGNGKFVAVGKSGAIFVADAGNNSTEGISLSGKIGYDTVYLSSIGLSFDDANKWKEAGFIIHRPKIKILDQIRLTNLYYSPRLSYYINEKDYYGAKILETTLDRSKSQLVGGDIIQQINGHKIDNMDSAISILGALVPHSVAAIKFIRSVESNQTCTFFSMETQFKIEIDGNVQDYAISWKNAGLSLESAVAWKKMENSSKCEPEDAKLWETVGLTPQNIQAFSDEWSNAGFKMDIPIKRVDSSCTECKGKIAFYWKANGFDSKVAAEWVAIDSNLSPMKVKGIIKEGLTPKTYKRKIQSKLAEDMCNSEFENLYTFSANYAHSKALTQQISYFMSSEKFEEEKDYAAGQKELFCQLRARIIEQVGVSEYKKNIQKKLNEYLLNEHMKDFSVLIFHKNDYPYQCVGAFQYTTSSQRLGCFAVSCNQAILFQINCPVEEN
jgi:hypothetical protein